MKPGGLMIAIGAKPKAAGEKYAADDEKETDKASDSSASDKLFAEHASRVMAAMKKGDAAAFAKALKGAISACYED